MVKVSVIIPTYGNPTSLKECVESVIKQTFQEWELIIVDDNNPESEARNKTEFLVSKYLRKESRICYIKHECNKNGAAARNTGFAIAKGDYIALLDSDDEYMPFRLRKCFDIMEKAPLTIAGVYTGCEFRRKGKAYSRFTDVKDGNYLVETLACKFNFCTGSNIFVRKSVVDELHGFDESFLRHQDYDFLVRLFMRYSLISIPEVLVIKNNENVNLPNPEKIIDIKKQYLDKYESIIKNLSVEEQNFIYFWNNVSIAEAAMAKNNFKLANTFYKKARQFKKIPLRLWIRRFLFPIYNLTK